MLDTTSYLIAWAIYMGAAVVLLALWWRLTRRRRGLLQILLRVLPAAWILVPIQSRVHDDWWMPALIVATLGTIADGWDVGAGGVAALILATLLALIAGFVGWWLQRRSAAGARPLARSEASTGAGQN